MEYPRVTAAELRRLKRKEDKEHLAQLEVLWLRFELLKLLETDPFERVYWTRLEQTAYEEITRLQGKMVRRYL